MKSVFFSTVAALALSVGAFAQVGPLAVINYSGFNPQAPLAPGSIASAYGNFGTVATTVAASVNPLPTTLAAISVRVNNVNAPLYFVSSGQINFVVPVATPVGRQAVEVLSGGTVIARGEINFWEAFPALASSDTSLTSQGIIQNQDFAINSQSARARRGEIIQLYATGCGATNPAVTDGRPPAGLSPTVLPVTATISGVTATVQFAGAHPQFPGICQVNITVPNQAFITGQSVVLITVGGIASNPVSVWVE
ncbi:MAG: hypothetical protein OHK0021_15580 [Bryobacter sp.]